MADKKYRLSFEMTDGTKQSVEFTIPIPDKDEIIAEILAILNSPLISFTIDGWETYQAKEGMTWAEWIASDYNTIGAKADGTDVIFPDDPEWNSTWYILDADGNSVHPDDVLIAGYTYLVE